MGEKKNLIAEIYIKRAIDIHIRLPYAVLVSARARARSLFRPSPPSSPHSAFADDVRRSGRSSQSHSEF